MNIKLAAALCCMCTVGTANALTVDGVDIAEVTLDGTTGTFTSLEDPFYFTITSTRPWRANQRLDYVAIRRRIYWCADVTCSASNSLASVTTLGNGISLEGVTDLGFVTAYGVSAPQQAIIDILVDPTLPAGIDASQVGSALVRISYQIAWDDISQSCEIRDYDPDGNPEYACSTYVESDRQSLDYSLTYTATSSVPLPAGGAMLGAALAGFGLRLRRDHSARTL